jgi:hypothetical protein
VDPEAAAAIGLSSDLVSAALDILKSQGPISGKDWMAALRARVPGLPQTGHPMSPGEVLKRLVGSMPGSISRAEDGRYSYVPDDDEGPVDFQRMIRP